jgi:hypothetical protein
MKKRLAKILVVVLAFAGLTTAVQAITIVPTYVDGAGYTWDSVRRGVIQQAINDWQTALPDSQPQINVTLDFTNAGYTYLGEWYVVPQPAPVGTNFYPWSPQLVQNIHFNADLFSGDNYTWWDPTPTTSADQPFAAWDALSVARHEIGHMMGFTDQVYVDHFYTPQEVDKWASHISGTTFDPGGTGHLNVVMEATYDLGHVSDSGSTTGDLMVTAIPNSIRRGISATDLNMLHLAYGYNIVIPATSTTYTLTATAGKTAIHKNGSCTITATIVNTGTGTADTLDYTGLAATSSGSGSITGSATSGGPVAKAGGSDSNTGLTFSSATTGTFTITPVASAATNHTLGTAATKSSTTTVLVSVYSGQGVWNTTGSGVWTDTSKWTAAGGVPGIDGALSAADTAYFYKTFPSLATVSLNGATPRLSILALQPSGSVLTIAKGTGGSLTMQATTGRASIIGYTGSSIISAPVVLGSDAQIGCNAGVTLNFSGGISGNHTLTVASSITASSIQVDTLQIGASYWIPPTAAVPEPSTLALLGMGALGTLAVFRRWWKA